jgi:hypothetical protein
VLMSKEGVLESCFFGGDCGVMQGSCFLFVETGKKIEGVWFTLTKRKKKVMPR